MKSKQKSREEFNPFLEANKNLNKRIAKLEKALANTAKYKEMFESNVLKVERLEELLDLKRSVVKIIGITDDREKYALMVKRVEDTDEGLYVEVHIPKIMDKKALSQREAEVREEIVKKVERIRDKFIFEGKIVGYGVDEKDKYIQQGLVYGKTEAYNEILSQLKNKNE